MEKLKREKGISIMLEKSAEEPIILAAKDLQKDLRIVSGDMEVEMMIQNEGETDSPGHLPMRNRN